MIQFSISNEFPVWTSKIQASDIEWELDIRDSTSVIFENPLQPVAERGFGFLVHRLSNRVLQALSGLEGGDVHGGDVDALGGIAGVHAGAGGALADTEGAEAGDRHVLAALQLLGDVVDNGIQRNGGGLLGDAGRGRDGSDEFLLGHKGDGLESKHTAVYWGPIRLARASGKSDAPNSHLQGGMERFDCRMPFDLTLIIRHLAEISI